MKSQNKQSVWTCMSEKAFSADVHWMTIFTPAYQREATMECFIVHSSLTCIRLSANALCWRLCLPAICFQENRSIYSSLPC